MHLGLGRLLQLDQRIERVVVRHLLLAQDLVDLLVFLGEGVGGVNVSVSGTATQAVTARSGGYAVPVAGNGTYTVTFSGPGITTSSQQVTVASLENPVYKKTHRAMSFAQQSS